jgi:hypothetical protein
MAQMHDMENEAVKERLEGIESREELVFKELKGTLDGPLGEESRCSSADSGDPGIYMTAERMNAWAHLMWYDVLINRQPLSGLFLTTSMSAFNHVLEKTGESILLYDREIVGFSNHTEVTLNTWRETMMRQLEEIARMPWKGEARVSKPPVCVSPDMQIEMTLAVITNKSPGDCFPLNQEMSFLRQPEKAALMKNTLIGWVHG